MGGYVILDCSRVAEGENKEEENTGKGQVSFRDDKCFRVFK